MYGFNRATGLWTTKGKPAETLCDKKIEPLLKTVSEYYITNGTRPPTTFNVQNNTSKMVESVEWDVSVIRIVGQSNSTGLGTTVEITMKPTLTASGGVEWTCAPVAGTRFMPSSCQ